VSWQKVKAAFFVEKDGKCKHIDIGVCSNCNGIHIPAEEASACECKTGEILNYEEIKKKFDDIRYYDREVAKQQRKPKMILFREMTDKDGNLDYINRYKNVRDAYFIVWGIFAVQVIFLLKGIIDGKEIVWYFSATPALVTVFLAILIYQISYKLAKHDKERMMKKCYEGI